MHLGSVHSVYCTFKKSETLRSNLGPVTLQHLTTLHYWYRYEHDIGEANKQRESESARRCDKFATLALRGDQSIVDNGEDYCDSDSSDEDI